MSLVAPFYVDTVYNSFTKFLTSFIFYQTNSSAVKGGRDDRPMTPTHRRRKLLKSGRRSPILPSPPTFPLLNFLPLILPILFLPFPTRHLPSHPLRPLCSIKRSGEHFRLGPTSSPSGVQPKTHFGAFSGRKMHLWTTNLARCYAVRMIKLKQILLHKRWQLIFLLLFRSSKSGSANSKQYGLSIRTKKWSGTARLTQ